MRNAAAAARRRNTFSKFAGSTYACQKCGRQTRHTGAQALGSKTCPQCWDLAGIENEISDGHSTIAEQASSILALVAELVAKGGSMDEWNGLVGRVHAAHDAKADAVAAASIVNPEATVAELEQVVEAAQASAPVVTIEKSWDANEGVREGRNGRAYTTRGRWQWFVVVDGVSSQPFDTKREAVAARAEMTRALAAVRALESPVEAREAIVATTRNPADDVVILAPARVAVAAREAIEAAVEARKASASVDASAARLATLQALYPALTREQVTSIDAVAMAFGKGGRS